MNLKHLSPYLPYKLKILNGWGDIGQNNHEAPVLSNTVLAERIITFLLCQIIAGIISYYVFRCKLSSIVSTQTVFFFGFTLSIFWFRKYFR